MPLTKVSTLESLLAAKPTDGMALLTVHLSKTRRAMGVLFVKDIAGEQQVVGIIEQKDASPEQLKINAKPIQGFY